MPSTTHIPTSPENSQAIASAIDAVNLAACAKSSIEELRAVLKAVHRLASHDETIRDLARVGINIADDRHNMFDCDCEAMEEKLAALKGGRHA